MLGKGQKRRQYKTGKSLPPSGYLLRYLVSSSCIRENREEFNSKIETYTLENHKNTEKSVYFYTHIVYTKEIIWVFQFNCNILSTIFAF